jgi:hypothetical protein
MKVYAVRDGRMHWAEVPDGAICMAIWSQDDGTGRRLAPIDAIDWERKVYRRAPSSTEHPFPDKWYRDVDCDWQPCAVQELEADRL